MKKIIIFLFSSYLVFGYISVSANRYNVHSVPYDQGGMTSCDDDWNGAVWNCAQISWSPSVWTAWSCLSWPLTVTSPWNIPCLYWDEEAPTISIDLGSYINNTWTNSIVTATPICNDAWWSWCKAGSYEYKVSSSIFACN